MPGSQNAVSRTGSFRAVVQAGATSTVYLRAGAGRPVLVLRRSTAPHPLWTPLITAVSDRFRVIAPEIEGGRDDFGQWLRHFLDGLGVPPVHILADEAMAAPAIGFAILEADRVERLVVISPDGPPAANEIIPSGPPVLLMRDDVPSEELIAAVMAFLEPAQSAPQLRRVV